MMASILPIFGFLGLSVLELVEARDIQIDRQTDRHHHNAPSYGGRRG